MNLLMFIRHTTYSIANAHILRETSRNIIANFLLKCKDFEFMANNALFIDTKFCFSHLGAIKILNEEKANAIEAVITIFQHTVAKVRYVLHKALFATIGAS